MTSRITKLLREATQSSRLAEAASLRDVEVRLLVGQEADATLVRTAVALLLRCFTGRVMLTSPSGVPLPSKLVASAEVEAAEFEASDRLVLGDGACGLALGLACPGGDVFADAAAGAIFVNRLANRRALVASPAAALAAAAGVAKLFVSLVGRPDSVKHETWTLDLLPATFTVGRDLDLGRVLIIGAGAIGGGLVHVLRHSGWAADLKLIDRERYDEPNEETTLCIAPTVARNRLVKAHALAAALTGTAFHVDSEQLEVGQDDPLLHQEFDAIVCAVDNAELRRRLDHTPAVVLNAGVGGSAEDAGHVLFSRHGREDGPLSRLYPATDGQRVSPPNFPQEVAADECSRLAYANETLAAPFVAVAAGALLASGLAREALALPCSHNYLKIDMLALQQRYTSRLIPAPITSGAAAVPFT